MAFVNLLEVGLVERALLLQRLVDRAVERRIIAGRVIVPDFEIARRSRLRQGANLAERNLGKRKRSFVLFARHGHGSSPRPSDTRKSPAAARALPRFDRNT
jgi:hypothetical protein